MQEEMTAEELGRKYQQEGKPKCEIPFNFFKERDKYMDFFDGYYGEKYGYFDDENVEGSTE